jgi:circadian clock protein KaiC
MSQTEPGGSDDGELDRVPSLVPGLDAILRGGFLRGGLYMIQGPPGAGKTILASQIIYRRAAAGERSLFVTVLGESHGRMMLHLRPMRFFDQSLIPDQVSYVSAYAALEEEGLRGLLELITREVLSRDAALLVLDGLSAVEAKVGIGFEMKRFTHELQTLASATDCTMLLLTSMSGVSGAPEQTMVDGLIELRQRLYGLRSERRILIHKLRGSPYLEGEHAFRITNEGIGVFPRIESLLALPTRQHAPPLRDLSSGIPSLDNIIGGGIPGSTMMSVIGPSGSGKTTLSLHFLSRSNAREPGLLLGCFEPPERLRRKAAALGFDLAAAERRLDVEILWHPIGENVLDELAHRLLDAVRRRGIKRLVIDGMSVFQEAALEPERLIRFWSALSNELRALEVTTLHTFELPELATPHLRLPASGIPSLAEIMLLVRYVELQSRLYRLVSVFKMRDGAFDPTIREFQITDAGIRIGTPFEGVEAVLSGVARTANAAPVPIAGRDPDPRPGGAGAG